MKLRWRDNEMLLAASLTVLAIVKYWWQMDSLAPQQMQERVKQPYSNSHLIFDYYKNVLMPQADVVLLFFLAYLCINWIVIAAVKRLTLQQRQTMLKRRAVLVFKSTLLFVLVFVVQSFLVALGVNIASYYAHPWLFNYRGFGLLALVGYNDRPLTNYFIGFDRALLLSGIYAAYALMREIVTAYLVRRNAKKVYRVMVINNVTLVLFLYILGAWVLSSFNLVHEQGFMMEYIGLLGPVLLTVLSNIYWLFPLAQEEASPFSSRILLRLLVSTCIYSLLFFFYSPINFHPLLFIPIWLAQVFITTPVTWLFWQRAKGKILQLRGMEKELNRSKADVQFLRSQINPHFLFNVLNTIYGTALQENAGRTAESIQMLGDMMRFMLHDNTSDVIPMQREIEYLQNYIALQSLRIQSSPNITLQTNINTAGCSHNIAPMLLIPFVENAFKHGISLREPSWIKIELRCDEHNVWFNVYNSMHPQQDSNTEKNRSGIGIVNVKKRLQASYTNKHTLVYNADGREFFVQLNIQF